MKSGFICIAGLANAGKSTLINALVGEKVSIVSWRPQTTRNKILGILNGDDYQIVLIDTPGIHKAKNQLGEFMMQSVSSGLKDVEGVIYVIDASRGMQKEDYEFIEKYAEVKPLIVVLNKEDAVTRETMFFSLDKLNKLNGIKAIIPMSAKKGGNLEPLMNEILSLMPEGAAMFPDD
ncbi:MAG: GTPase Era, partial [Clostridia bacterium]